MSAPLIRLWVLLLAVLIQLGTMQLGGSQVRSEPALSATGTAHAPDSTSTDATEELSERVALDDIFEASPDAVNSAGLSAAEPRPWRHCWNTGLSSGRPTSSALFKPPRG